MIALITVLCAFPLGFLLRSRLSACVAYIAIFSYTFTFQSVDLVRGWVGDRTRGFPEDPQAVSWEYLAVTGAIYLIGFGLIVVGHRLGTKRRNRTTAVDLDPAR